MKKAILVIMAFLSFSAMANTLNCNSRTGNSIASKSIESTKVTTIEFNDMSSDRYSFKVEYMNSVLTYQVYEMNSGLLMEEDTIDFTKGDKLNLVNGINCSIID